MAFTTLQFIGFFAALFFAYYAIPKRFQWWLLLGGSMFFYGYASPYYLLLLLTTVSLTYIGAVATGAVYRRRDEYLSLHKGEMSRDEKKDFKAAANLRAKRWLTVTIIALLLLLGVFKYAQFAIDNLIALFTALLSILPASPSTPTPIHYASSLHLLLPIGLSFYIFQSMGYCIDVYREEVLPEKNFFKHALFVSFFPQLLQGPIGNYGRLAPQLIAEHSFDYQQAKFGLQRIAWGFFKKLMIANVIADRINPCWANIGDYEGLFCWGAILFLYAIQLYADFSGYMDIACGCSQMLGIKLDENFNCPYFATSIADFWRRWHMTLSEWFKNYLFYPLLRSDWNSRLRKFFSNKYLSTVLPTSMALAIVWFTTGLWHGASWGYVVWGVYYGLFMIAGIALAPLYDRLHAISPRFFESRPYSIFQMLRTFAIVVLGYAIFKPADLCGTLAIVQQCLNGNEAQGVYTLQYTLHHSFIKVFFWMAMLMAVDIYHLYHPLGSLRETIAKLPLAVRWTGYMAVLWAIIFFGLYGSGFDQFEYFKF